MVRTQLYLPDDLYKTLKKNAKEKKMTFASYVRVYLENEATPKEKEKTLFRKYPFMKLAGTFHWGKNSADNDEIDKIYDFV